MPAESVAEVVSGSRRLHVLPSQPALPSGMCRTAKRPAARLSSPCRASRLRAKLCGARPRLGDFAERQVRVVLLWVGLSFTAFVQTDVEEEMAGRPAPSSGGLVLVARRAGFTRRDSPRDGRHGHAYGVEPVRRDGRAGPFERDRTRCSWTPNDDDLAPHVRAFCDVMCSMAGLPPTQPVGVLPLPITR